MERYLKSKMKRSPKIKPKVDKEMVKYLKGLGKKDTDVHYVYHKFLNKFMTTKRGKFYTMKIKNKKGQIVKKRFQSYKDEFKFIGYKLMIEAEKFAKLYPDYVQVVRCDDDWHAGSSLIIIQHKNKKDYMGTTIQYIPQCTGEQPIRFFLYDSHRTSLIKALKNIGTTIRKGKLTK